jgi:hypothetical protein
MKGLLWFTALMILLGLATIVFIESQTNENLLPDRESIEASTDYKRKLSSYKIRYYYWKDKLARKLRNLNISLPGKSLGSKTDDRSIIKWQDENGVWHFEHAPEASPAPENTEEVDIEPENSEISSSPLLN